jgi:hypothetical protein
VARGSVGRKPRRHAHTRRRGPAISGPRDETAMHEVDGKNIGFDWIDPDNAEDSVIAFLEMGAPPAE